MLTITIDGKYEQIVRLAKDVSSIKGITLDEAAQALIYTGWLEFRDTLLEVAKNLGSRLTVDE